MTHEEILEKLTDETGWESVDGPDSRCGVDYYYKNESSEAYINDDQGFLTVVVDGQGLFSGEIEDLEDNE